MPTDDRTLNCPGERVWHGMLLRELAIKHRLFAYYFPDQPMENAMAFGSDLLLVAKEKLAVKIENGSYADIPGCYRQLAASELRDSDWGHLFEEKV